MENQVEIWKDIFGYEGFYQVSNLGRVQSLNSTIITKKGVVKPKYGMILRLTVKNNKYLSVMFSVKSEQKRFHVHRLVANAFLENTEKKPQVNHINCKKDDNNLLNLEWCTAKENTQHAISNNLTKKGIDSYSSKLTEENVLAIRRLYRISPNFHKTNVAKKLGVRDSAIHKIINNQRWKHLL